MARNLHMMFSALLLTILLASCSSEETDEPEGTEESPQVVTEENAPEPEHEPDEVKEDEYNVLKEAPVPPASIEDILYQPVGEFAGKTYDEHSELFLERLRELPALDEVNEDILEHYWNTVYSLFAVDFPSPQDLIDSWKKVSFGSPDMEDSRYQFKDQFNVEIILDASGSMAGTIGNKSKMEIAKEAILTFTEELPEGANVGLRVYGHKGTGSDADKSLSCGSSELVYNIGPFEQGKFNEALNQFAPAGWTPIALALDEAAKDLAQYPGEQNTNIIYLVSDGIATCDDDPVQAAKNIAESDIQPIVNVIGFDVNAEGQNQLKEVARAADGVYSNANSQDQLQTELDRAKEMAGKWEEWKVSATYKAKSAHHHQFFDAMGFWNEWRQANQEQNRNIWYTLLDLKNEGHISQKAFKYLENKRKIQFDLIDNEGSSVYEDLKQLNESNLQDMLEQIEEKYQSQDL